VVLLVVDEAHRAKGKHAFATVTQAIRQENPYLRVLGKTRDHTTLFDVYGY
jgi:ERCC4-related helicase